MDARKLELLLRSLCNIDTLEILNLGNDQLKDDCGTALVKMFLYSKSLKSLELEGNEVGPLVMMEFANAFKSFHIKLQYLGLRENPLTDEGLHALASSLIGTENVKHLCLSGLIDISEQGLICCICNELLRQHKHLTHLDLTCIKMSPKVGQELLAALQVNQTIQQMDCRACGLDVDSQFEIDLLLKRNRYIFKNPYVGDKTKSSDEIQEFVSRIK